MVVKINKSFWWGVGVGILVSFVVTYLAWPDIPLDTQFRDGVKVLLPDERDKAQITYPLDGAKVGGKFLVYGVGSGFENKGEIVVEDQQGQIISNRVVDFLGDGSGASGVFVVLVDLGVLEESQEAGFIRLYGYSESKDGKREISKTHVRFR